MITWTPKGFEGRLDESKKRNRIHNTFDPMLQVSKSWYRLFGTTKIKQCVWARKALSRCFDAETLNGLCSNKIIY